MGVLVGQNNFGPIAAGGDQLAIGNEGVNDIENGFLREVRESTVTGVLGKCLQPNGLGAA